MAKIKKGQGVGVDVVSAEIVDGTIVAVDIADKGITGGKLADGAVDTLQIAADAVDATKIADDSIGIEHINGGVPTAEHVVKVNATNDGLEFGLASVDPDGNMTIEGSTHTVREWMVAL